MIEQGIYFALGCIVTALGAMMFAPIFWRRALRLTRRRLQLEIPLSMQEIFAERDQLRAEFAVERLKIEQDLERVRDGKARDMAELGRRSMEVARLADKLAALRIVEQGHEAEIDRLSREIADRDSEIAGLKVEALTATDVAGRLRRDASTSAREAADSRARSVELQASQAKLTAEIAGLKMELGEAHELVGRLQKAAISDSREAAHLRTLLADLTAVQNKADSLEIRLAEAHLLLTEAGEREKTLQLSGGMTDGEREKTLQLSGGMTDGERASDPANAARIEARLAENKQLHSALDPARRASTPETIAANDGGLRESIHALGIAVAAMTRDARRSTPSETASKGETQAAL